LIYYNAAQRNNEAHTKRRLESAGVVSLTLPFVDLFSKTRVPPQKNTLPAE